jgi:hypothetical protein
MIWYEKLSYTRNLKRVRSTETDTTEIPIYQECISAIKETGSLLTYSKCSQEKGVSFLRLCVMFRSFSFPVYSTASPSLLYSHIHSLAQSVYRLATGWTIGVQGFDFRRGWEFFASPPISDRLWAPPSVLSNGYRRRFPRGRSG